MHRYFLAGAAAGAAIMLAVSTPAKSADIVEPEPVVEHNWYISLHGGWKFDEEWQDEMDLGPILEPPVDTLVDPATDVECGDNSPNTPPGPCNVLLDLDLDTDGGFRVGGAIGFQFSDIFAIEGEVSWASQEFDEGELKSATVTETQEDVGQTDFDTVTLPCGPAVTGPLGIPSCINAVDGDLSILTGMINLIAGFPLGEVIRPYVGVGAGFAHVSFEDVGVITPSICCLDDSDTAFAAQVFAGIDLMFGDRWGIGGRYRYVHISDVELTDDGGFSHDLDPDGIQSAEVVLTFGF
jgi:opacity protein-like surface antigen